MGKPEDKGIIWFVPSFTASEWDIVLASWDSPPEMLTYLEQRTLQKDAANNLRKQGIEVRAIRMDPLKMLS